MPRICERREASSASAVFGVSIRVDVDVDELQTFVPGSSASTATTPRVIYSGLVSMERSRPPSVAEGVGISAVQGPRP